MKYHEIIQAMALKQHQLGMTDTYIARHAGLSQPTVNRILSGRHLTARLDHILLIAEVLGMEMELLQKEEAGYMRQKQAEFWSRKNVDAVMGTISLEGQGFGEKQQQEMIEREIPKFLAGPGRKLWSD